jgi:hypothetical protein
MKQGSVCVPSLRTTPEESVRGKKAKENMCVFAAVDEACQSVSKRCVRARMPVEGMDTAKDASNPGFEVW